MDTPETPARRDSRAITLAETLVLVPLRAVGRLVSGALRGLLP